MFRNNSVQESQKEDKVVSGRIINIENSYIIIQENDNISQTREVIITNNTSIYHDFNSDRLRTEKADKGYLKINDDVIIGLINSKNEIPLTAKVIHILPTN
jgi:hypothetical protein